MICADKLHKDGYCDMSEYIYSRIKKEEMYYELSREKSMFSKLYKRPIPKHENALLRWNEFFNETNFLCPNDKLTLSYTEAKAIVNWVYRTYNTVAERKTKTTEILPVINQAFNLNDLVFADSIIYQESRVDIIFVNTIERLLKLIKSISDPERTIFFRGHSDSNYSLLPSIMRSNKWLEHECDLYNELTIECPNDFSKCKSHLDILVEMQHYGLPTRLLDVTKNPLVALYFACVDSPNTNGELVVFDVKNSTIKFPGSDTVSILASLPLFQNDMKNHFWELSHDHEISDVEFNQGIDRLLHEVKLEKPAFREQVNREDLLNCFFVQAEKKNSRIIKQDGAFIICGLIDMEHNVINDYRYNENGKTQIYIIHHKKKHEFLEYLNAFSINKAQLFPEISDVASHIKNKY